MRRRWLRSLPLRWRLIALLAALAGLLVVDAGLVARYTSSLTTQQQRLEVLRPAEEVPERLLAGLAAQQNAVRGYALTGEERLLATYQDTQRIEGRAIARLRRILRGRPELLALVGDFARSADRWHGDVAEPVIRAVRAGDMPEAARLVRRRDQRLFSQMADAGDAVSDALDDQVLESQLRATAAGLDLQRQLYLSSAAALVLLLLSAWLVRRWLTRPVGDLSVQLRGVASGDLQQQITAAGPPEFVRLGDDAEVMRRRILDELEETRRAFEGLQQNAPLVASLREELMSSHTPMPAGLRVVTRFEPAEGVLAGDWVQTLGLEDNRLDVVVVDVSGHGAEAGLRALWLKHLLVPALSIGLEPSDALHWVVGQIGDTGDWFATCVVVEIHAPSGKCVYANAGHPPPLLIGRDGLRRLTPTGPLFSDLPGSRWDNAEFTLAEDDVVVVYTDGIVEARSPGGEEFGEHRLEACLTAAYGHGIDAIADYVMSCVHAFGGRLLDDATLVLATRAGVRTGVARATAGPQSRQDPGRARRWV
jgi:serine phosphatase RsbU (regulator of sigma subunit)/CHASE3 domain sensor protein